MCTKDTDWMGRDREIQKVSRVRAEFDHNKFMKSQRANKPTLGKLMEPSFTVRGSNFSTQEAETVGHLQL